MNKGPLILLILDGFAIIDENKGNAVNAANKPNFDYYYSKYPKTSLGASGLDVGLPDGQMGNSEVGHLNIGAGRIVYQELTRITKSIADGDFFDNKELLSSIKNASDNNKSLHLMGLFSDGGVHSHIDHLKALVSFAKKENVDKVYIHAFTDGRDTSPNSAIIYTKNMLDFLYETGLGEIATISGRYYAMDRDNRWERIEKAYRAVVEAKGEKFTNPLDAIENSYNNNVTDEFIVPVVNQNYNGIEDGDSVIFFNFRPDRGRELTRAIVDDGFSGFLREKKTVNYVTMTQYDADIKNVDIAFKPQTLENTFGEYISGLGLSQLRIAETEKYPHVTFFFNGGYEKSYDKEGRILVNSPKVATYDLQPEMSAYEIKDKLLEDLKNNPKDVIILNFANGDMVGHTGVFDAAVKAIETVDECIGEIVPKILELNGTALITADHGNAEQMLAEDGTPFTAHTTNRVPFVVVSNTFEGKLRDNGRLSDIAPTMLDILNIEKPVEMTGESLITK